MYIMHNYKKGLIVKIIQYKLMGEYVFFLFFLDMFSMQNDKKYYFVQLKQNI